MSDPTFPGIGHVALTVSDLPRSVDWYQRLFDAEPVSSRENPAQRVASPHRSAIGLSSGFDIEDGCPVDRFETVDVDPGAVDAGDADVPVPGPVSVTLADR